MIKTNFDETNRKFEEVNKAVNSLDANLEKANKIEKDVEELKETSLIILININTIV
jgi:hypothetical protein